MDTIESIYNVIMTISSVLLGLIVAFVIIRIIYRAIKGKPIHITPMRGKKQNLPGSITGLNDFSDSMDTKAGEIHFTGTVTPPDEDTKS